MSSTRHVPTSWSSISAVCASRGRGLRAAHILHARMNFGSVRKITRAPPKRGLSSSASSGAELQTNNTLRIRVDSLSGGLKGGTNRARQSAAHQVQQHTFKQKKIKIATPRVAHDDQDQWPRKFFANIRHANGVPNSGGCLHYSPVTGSRPRPRPPRSETCMYP